MGQWQENIHIMFMFSIGFSVYQSAFLPHDALHSAVFAVMPYPSVCLSVRHTPVLCLNG